MLNIILGIILICMGLFIYFFPKKSKKVLKPIYNIKEEMKKQKKKDDKILEEFKI